MFYITIPYFSLSNIYNSCQAIGWKKVTDNKFIIVHKDKIVQVTQRKENFSFSCSEEEFYETWYDYFDLGTDYSLHHNFFRSIDKEDLMPMCNKCKGLHILRQDTFKVLIYSIFYEKLKTFSGADILCEMLSQHIGKKRKKTISGQVINWFEFPSAENILKKSDILDRNMFIKFKHDILNVCNLIVDGWLDLDYLSMLSASSAANAREYLESCGISKICIKFVMILALHKTSYFICKKYLDTFIKNNFCMCIEDFVDWSCKKSRNKGFYKRNISYLNFVLIYNCLGTT